ncbi:hypothetical protein SDC9_84729 [bioreactor metagenome]|uniref:Uncharacterized protein n=2 Tax=root TaxID=1 RepID=A0A212JRU0_9BACT|nr:hypothetical protein [Desulfovibrio desulfuricans]MCB6541351.1 hypothetical protein [Desulfovibrio desulfuricans]MCB6552433.1 hypothetical protein [Desulfovibrio desulfuricans]MCB6564320.1 hypothetical protein [Desulfovibrio desulfuricans]MCB7345456.1 hypothetical protein [Desulfovibrio desulfuricans]MCQ5218064.1 hypothetical protein [Desulfovibrio desulfuricans]
MSTNDFQAWLDDNVDPDEYGQVDSLYQAVSARQGYDDGFWEISFKNDQMFIRSNGGDWLRLGSENAISCFLGMMDDQFGNGMGVEAWAAAEAAIDNDKS